VTIGTMGTSHAYDAQNYKFTGKERDAESGLDNFGARYLASNLGRFMTPDWAARPTTVPYAVFGDPQSLNLYGYVRNDPVTNADLDGHCSGGGGSISHWLAACWGWATNENGSLVKIDPPKRQTQAQNQRVAVPVANCPGCTKDQAAIQAETKALRMTRDALQMKNGKATGKREEFFGLVLYNKKSHSYAYTESITFGDSGHSYPNSIIVPGGYLLSADYHTHPHVDSAEGQGFSCCQLGDAGHAVAFNRTGYVADTISGNLYRFTPGVTVDNGPTEITGDFVTHIQ
jgi:RHS repeat-associated protein